MNKKIVIVIFICFLLLSTTTVYAFSFQSVFDSINNFFDKIFGRETVGSPPDCTCNTQTNIGCTSSQICQSGPCQQGEGNNGICVTGYLLTVSKVGQGIISSEPSGIDCGLSCSHPYLPTTIVTLTATPDTGYTFTEWSGACSGIGTCQVTMNQARSVTATFTSTLTLYTLTVTKSGAGTGSVTSTNGIFTVNNCGPSQSICTASFQQGPVTLNAIPSSQSLFGAWSGEYQCSESGSQCTIQMNSDRDMGAGFQQAPQQYTLNVVRQGVLTNNNIISNSPIPNGINCGTDCTNLYNAGSNILLVANTATGYVPVWGSDCIINGNACMVQGISSSKTITVNFVQGYTLTVGKDGTGTGTIVSEPSGINCGSICNVPFQSGTVTLTANPNPGYFFQYFTGCNSANSNVCTVNLNSNKQVTATFSKELCNDKSDNDGDLKTDCNDTEDCPPNIDLGGYRCDSDKILHELNFTDGIDNDIDGVKDKLDYDCQNIGNFQCNALNVTTLQYPINNLYQYFYLGFVNCNYNKLLVNDGDSTSISNCIKLSVNSVNCTDKQYFPTYMRFNNCYLGTSIGSNIAVNNIKCYIDSKCRSANPAYNQTLINITKFPICNYNTNNKGDVGANNLQITGTSGIENLYQKGDVIEADIKVLNSQANGLNMDVKVEAWVVDTTTGDIEIEDEANEQTIEYGNEKTFSLDLDVPYNLSTGNNTYGLYYKAYKKNYQNQICLSDSSLISFEAGTCPDEDDDGYTSDDCGGQDCDDDNSTIKPGATEICTDSLDNNCNGLTDFADSSCTPTPPPNQCTETWNCGDWQPSDENCNNGETQVRNCLDGNQCGTTNNKPAVTKTCGQGYNDLSDVDSDNDGLPDEWEYAYFGNLGQGPNDDYDGDGMTNAQEYASNTNPKVNEQLYNKKGGLGTILVVIGIILLIAVVAILIYFKFLNKKRERGKQKNIQESNENRLTAYINQCKQQGLGNDAIRNELLKAGWKREDIDKYLR